MWKKREKQAREGLAKERAEGGGREPERDKQNRRLAALWGLQALEVFTAASWLNQLRVR